MDLFGVDCVSKALCSLFDGFEGRHVYEFVHLLVTGVLDDGQGAVGSLMLALEGLAIPTFTLF